MGRRKINKTTATPNRTAAPFQRYSHSKPKPLSTHLDQHVRRPKEQEEELQQRQHQQRAREHDGGKDAAFVEVVLAGEAAGGGCLVCVCVWVFGY